MKGLLLSLAFLAGLVITWFMSVKRSTRPAGRSGVDSAGGSAGVARVGGAGAGLAGSITPAYVDSDVETPDFADRRWASEVPDVAPRPTTSDDDLDADVSGEPDVNVRPMSEPATVSTHEATPQWSSAPPASFSGTSSGTFSGILSGTLPPSPPWPSEVTDVVASPDEDLDADVSVEPEANLPTMDIDESEQREHSEDPRDGA